MPTNLVNPVALATQTPSDKITDGSSRLVNCCGACGKGPYRPGGELGVDVPGLSTSPGLVMHSGGDLRLVHRLLTYRKGQFVHFGERPRRCGCCRSRSRAPARISLKLRQLLLSPNNLGGSTNQSSICPSPSSCWRPTSELANANQDVSCESLTSLNGIHRPTHHLWCLSW